MTSDHATRAIALDLYERLLDYLGELRETGDTWVALPGDIDRWWRQRRGLRLDWRGNRWQVSGAGAERARVAFAYRDSGRIRYRVEGAA